MKLRNTFLENRIKEVEEELECMAMDMGSTFKKLIDINIGDPEPKDAKERVEYVGEVARLHQTVLRPKMLHMIHNSHVLLESESNSALQDNALKGAVYAFRELIRWGDLLVSEHAANSVGENPASAQDNK